MRAGIALIAALLCGCSSPEDDGPECPPIAQACTPQYEPTFANIHARTVGGSCATGGFACHGSVDASGGYSFATESEAYGSLVELAEGAECSSLWQRLTSLAPSSQMPPGKPLSAGELCAIGQWIEAGTPR